MDMEILRPDSHISEPDMSAQHRGFTGWTRAENKRFESALAIFDHNTPDRWARVAAMIPGKTVCDVLKRYQELEEDVRDIEEGVFAVPDYLSGSVSLEELNENHGVHETKKKSPSAAHERKKGVPWTEAEHRRFLMGLLKHGKGDWRNISRNFVISKTATQVASHAQKYFQRQEQQASSGGKDKKRPSIHDITTVNLREMNDQSVGKMPISPHQKSRVLPVPAHPNLFVPSMGLSCREVTIMELTTNP